MRRLIFLTLLLNFVSTELATAGVAILRPYRSETALVVRGNLDEDLLSRLVLEETNRYRSSKGRPPLTAMRPLMIAAQDHSDSMADNQFFAHRNPVDARQRTLTDRIRRVGMNPSCYAENIAMTFTRDFNGSRARDKKSRTAPTVDFTYRALAKSVVQQWVNSRGHRKNMLGSTYNEIGLGFATVPDANGYERVYCVQTFAGSERRHLR